MPWITKANLAQTILSNVRLTQQERSLMRDRELGHDIEARMKFTFASRSKFATLHNFVSGCIYCKSSLHIIRREISHHNFNSWYWQSRQSKFVSYQSTTRCEYVLKHQRKTRANASRTYTVSPANSQVAKARNNYKTCHLFSDCTCTYCKSPMRESWQSCLVSWILKKVQLWFQKKKN